MFFLPHPTSCSTTAEQPSRLFGLLTVFNILLFTSICAQNAQTETIWIESETSLIATANSHDGGTLTLTLLDDLNHGLSNARLEVLLKDKENNRDYTYSVKTNELGIAEIPCHLPNGAYVGFAEFNGYGDYRASQTNLQLYVAPCRTAASIQPSGTLFQPAGENVVLELKRTDCLDMEADYMAVMGSESHKLHLDKGQAATLLEFRQTDLEPGLYPIEITLFEGTRFDPEILHSEVVLYNELFAPNIRFHKRWLKDAFSAQMLYAVSALPAKLEFTDESGHSYDFVSTPNEKGIIEFAPINAFKGCIEYKLSRHDGKWEAVGTQTGQYCIEPITYQAFVPLIIAAATLAFSALAAIAYKKRKSRRRLPKPNNVIGTITSQPLLTTASTNTPSQTNKFTCVDNGTPIAPQELQIELNGTPVTVNKWPHTFEGDAQITIKHPKYMTYTGHLKHGLHHTLSLVQRRHYVIQCFEAVASQRLKTDITWGHLTPSQLLAQSKSPNRNLEQFCTCITSATFDTQPISDEMVHQIYETGKKI